MKASRSGPSDDKPVRLITKAMVSGAIDAAELEFEWCLKAIAPLGGHKADPGFADAFLSFQLRLLDAITALEEVYRGI